MSRTQKVLLACFGAYIGIFVLLVVIYGFSQHKNNVFRIQNEFKLTEWVHLGVFSSTARFSTCSSRPCLRW